MPRKQFFVITLVLGLVFLTACTGVSNQGDNTSAETTPVPVKLEFETNPSPPKTGKVQIIFTVSDQTGNAITGADFDVIADHTDMRGMTMHGKASEQTAGQYAIDADFSMSGMWKLSVQVRKGDLNYQEDIEVQIE